MKYKEQCIKMKKFMLENNIGINSQHGFFYWAKKIIDKNNGACLCNPKTRPKCPCPQALSEINRRGFCTCKLFGISIACNDCKKNCKFTYLPNNQK